MPLFAGKPNTSPVYFLYMQETTAIIENLNHYLSFASLIGIIGLVFWAVYLATHIYMKNTNTPVLSFVSKYVLLLGFLVTLGGMVLSLYYSEVLHVTACDLCWYQRIFMYSQVFIFGYAWYRKDRSVLPYTLLLSVAGFAIAVYQHMLQVGYDMYKPCSTAPFAVDCSKPTFIEFGFVTFPFMAVVLFLTVILLTVTSMKFAKHS